MYSLILLVHISLSYAQWPLQMIGSEEPRSVPRPSYQPGYPYDNLHQIDEWSDISRNPGLKLPETEESNWRILNVPTEPSTPTKDPENVKSIPDEIWIMERVKKFAEEHPSLRNETDDLMNQIQYFYLKMAMDEADNNVNNDSAYKYGMSVILRFLLEFYRIFRKMSSHSGQNQLSAIDVYGISYNNAVQVIKSKKSESPLQISIAVRRYLDILRSILYESVQIIQMKCSALVPSWQCVILYLANLITESTNCPHAWYHAFIHMLALETKIGIEDRFAYKIAQDSKIKDLVYFENIFDFLIDKIEEYREQGRVQLSAEAVVFTMLADLQENGLLNCVSGELSERFTIRSGTSWKKPGQVYFKQTSVYEKIDESGKNDVCQDRRKWKIVSAYPVGRKAWMYDM